MVSGCLPFPAVKRERRESSRDPPGPGGGRRFLELFPFSCAPLPLGKVLACSERRGSGAGTADSTTAWNAPWNQTSRLASKSPFVRSTPLPSPTAPSASRRPEARLLLSGFPEPARGSAGVGKVGGERSRRRKRAFTVGIRNSHPPANSLTARRGPLRLRGGPGGGGSAAPAPAPRPGAALTCPMEVPRRPPAPAPPARASPPGDLLVQAGSPPPATPPGRPAPEVFHLTSAFAASQMLKIPRHLSPGAYQGPEEGGGRRAPRPEISLREPGRGRAAGRGGARGGGASRGDPGSGGPAASPRLRTRAPREPPAPPDRKSVV